MRHVNAKDYCSPDAPHSLRIALVEAVEKAGMKIVLEALLIRATDAMPERKRVGYPLIMSIIPSGPFARACLTALRAAKSGKEARGGETE